MYSHSTSSSCGSNQKITKAQYDAKTSPRSSAPRTTDLAQIRRQAEQAEAARAREERRRREAERELAALRRERAKAARQPELVGTGTGFAINSRGHIVTNNHVVAGGGDKTPVEPEPATPEGAFAYVPSSNVSGIDLASNPVTATVAVGNGPWGVAITQ